MTDLNKKQLELLKKLAKTEAIAVSTLSLFELEIFKYLENVGCVAIKRYSAGVNYHGQKRPEELVSVSITEHGKAYLFTRKINDRRWRITTTIAVIALVSAIAAIVASPFFTAFFTKLYGLY